MVNFIKAAKNFFTGSSTVDPLSLPPGPQNQELTSRAYTSASRDALIHRVAMLGVTPEQVSWFAQLADQGDPRYMLELYQRMEETDATFAHCARIRKDRIGGLPWAIQPASEDPADIELAERMQTGLISRNFADEDGVSTLDIQGLMKTLQEAQFHGFAVARIIWEMQDGLLKPRFSAAHPRAFAWVGDRRRALRLRAGNGEVEELLADQWVVSRPDFGSQHEGYRGGLSRQLALLYVARGLAMRQWLVNMDRFGTPFIVGTYADGTSSADQNRFHSNLVNLSSDGVLTKSNSGEIEIQEINERTSMPFERFFAYTDGIIAKVVLSQVLTTSDGNSNAQATVHATTFIESVVKPDAMHAQSVISSQVFEPFVRMNFPGVTPERMPKFVIQSDQPDDRKTVAEVAKLLADSGLTSFDEKTTIERAGLKYNPDTGRAETPDE